MVERSTPPNPDSRIGKRPSLDSAVCFSLYSSLQATLQLYRDLLAPWGLTYQQLLVLVVLWEQGSVTPSELAQALHLDRSTVSGLLKRMERDGLLVRERHADNQRSVHVALTEYASGLRNELADIFTCVAEAMKLSEHDAYDLVTALHALRSAVRAQPTTTDVPSTEG